MGENIAAGYASASTVFTGWAEENEDYDNQGHRRNMLSSTFTAVGIGHVYYNGNHYWVQEFSRPATTSSTDVTTANDSSTTVAVTIDTANITSVSLTPSTTSCEVAVGDSIDLPGLTVEILLSSTWPSTLKPVTVDYSWTIDDSTYAAISDSQLTGIAGGTTELSTKVLGETVTVSVTVKPSVADCVITLSETVCTYDGTPQTPSVSIDGLTEDTDFTVEYSDNINAGTATVTVTGIGSYTGTATVKFTIARAEQTLTAVLKEDSIEFGETTVVSATGTGTISYSSSDTAVVTVDENGNVTAVNVGKAEITVTAAGDDNFLSAQAILAITVTPRDISGYSVFLSETEYTYDGTARTPEVTLNGLTNSVDYTVEYSNHINAGTATVTVTGTGNYTGTITASFTIAKAKQTLTASLDKKTVVYGDTAAITASGEGSITYSSGNTNVVTVDESGTVASVNVGTAEITVTASGNDNYLPDETVLSITVTEKNISDCTAALSYTDCTYDGTARTPEVTVSGLTEDTDFTVKYSDNTNAGTATVTITGTGNYTGTIILTFTIAKAEQDLTVSLDTETLEYGETASLSVSGAGNMTYGSDNTSVVTVDEEGTLTAVGIGSAVITIAAAGDDNYNSAETNFSIEVTAKDISCYTVVLSKTEYTYNGDTRTPEVTVSGLSEGDYTVEYSDNIDAGTATVTVSGTGNYTGTIKETFTIAKAEQELYASLEENSVEYGGATSVSISGSVEGSISYESSDTRVVTVDEDGKITTVNAGAAEITVTAAETKNYRSAQVVLSITVTPLDISDYTAEFSEAVDYIYDGTAWTPGVTVSGLSEGDYTVKYSDNINAGTATVTITGTGNYAGTITEPLTFTIARTEQTVTASLNVAGTLEYGDTASLTVSGEGSITYSSDNDSVVTVDEDGIVTAVAVGSASITVAAGGNNNYKPNGTTLTVSVTARDISGYTVTAYPDTFTYDGTVKSPSYVTVSGLTEDGYTVEDCGNNINAGSYTITVNGTGNYTGTATGTFTITKAAQTLTASLAASSITVGSTTAVTASGMGTIAYRSSDTSVATVDGTGTVTGVASGTADITVTAAGNDNYNSATKTLSVIVTAASSGSGTPSDSGSSSGSTPASDSGSTATTSVGDTYVDSTATYKVTAASGSTNTVTVSAVADKTLTSVTIPATVTISDTAYKVTAIADSAFSGCTKLKTVSIGSNVTSIGSKAFYGCTALTSVTMSSSVTNIGDSAFCKCTALTKITIGSGVTSIGKKAFYGCTKLKTVSGCSKVKTIGANAFYNCKVLATVKGCAAVTSVGSKAFYKCVKLTRVGSSKNTITLKKVKTIGSSAFQGCTAIKKVNLTSTALTTIGASAFRGCTAMTTFTSMSTKLKNIGKTAFYGDKKLATVTLKTSKLISSNVKANAFKGIKATCTFKVPSKKISTYKKLFRARGAGSKIVVKKG